MGKGPSEVNDKPLRKSHDTIHAFPMIHKRSQNAAGYFYWCVYGVCLPIRSGYRHELTQSFIKHFRRDGDTIGKCSPEILTVEYRLCSLQHEPVRRARRCTLSSPRQLGLLQPGPADEG